jgi:hypothetical protein
LVRRRYERLLELSFDRTFLSIYFAIMKKIEEFM